MDNDTIQKWAESNQWCFLCAPNANVLNQNMLNKASGVPNQVLHYRTGLRSGMQNVRVIVDTMAGSSVFYISSDAQGPYEAILAGEITRLCDLIEKNH